VQNSRLIRSGLTVDQSLGRQVRCAERRRPALPADGARPRTPASPSRPRALVFEGVAQPNCYTEPLLHKFRTEVKPSHLRPAAA